MSAEPTEQQRNANLTKELAAIGIPYTYPELRLSRYENAQLFGRAYLGWMRVSDTVTQPAGQELYSRCAEGDMDTTLTFDPTGEQSRRPAPQMGFIYAIVHSPTGSRFWRQLQAAVTLTGNETQFVFDETFEPVYGIPPYSDHWAEEPVSGDPIVALERIADGEPHE